jgi:hypothetical protein
MVLSVIAVAFMLCIGALVGRRLGALGTAAPEAAGSQLVAKALPGPDVRERGHRHVDLPRPPGNDVASGTRPLPDGVTAMSLAHTTADDYRQRARYPRWSQPLTDGEDPLLRDRQVSPVSSSGPGGTDPTLTVFPDQVSFESPEPVVLYAYLSAGGQRIAADEIRATIISEDGQPVAEIEYRDDGGGGDLLAGDGIYTAVLELDPAQAPGPAASYLVKVRAVTAEQQERLAAGGFLYSSPDAQLTGSYRDQADGGDLVIDAEVQATNTGRFHIEATLYSEDGQHAIAWAQQAAELPAGRHWLSLRFHGLILNERQIDGPYLLRYVALSTATQMPNAKNRLAENAFLTGTYTFNQFSDRPFDDPDLLDAADRIEQAIDGLAPEAEG